jgi:3-oxoacyl-[acyl-carrier-protein] synthase II
MTGHLLGAAGAVESIISVLAIRHNLVPPTINTQAIEEDFVGKFDFVLHKAQAKTINIALNNTFGFGGHIATTIFRKYP